MSLEGTIVNGEIELDSPIELPEGTRVRVEQLILSSPASSDDQVAKWLAKARKEREGKPRSPLAETLLSLAGTVHDLPPDFAAQHDHYIHGAAKK